MSINSSLHPPPLYCFYPETNFMSVGLFVTYMLLLPLFFSVLYVGYQRWRKRRCGSPAVMTSHLDVFTYNMVTMELTGIVGQALYCYGIFTKRTAVLSVASHIFIIISTGHTLLHALTCVDRYLAVVHAVTYLALRQAGGVRIRNMVVVGVWLLCFVVMTLSLWLFQQMIMSLLLLAVSTVVITFCSLSVLCVLIRPEPGEVGGNGERVNQAKSRAFRIMMVVMGVLLLRFFLHIVSYVNHSVSQSYYIKCLVSFTAICFDVPSSLVLPLLFLQRAGKLPGRRPKSVGAA